MHALVHLDVSLVQALASQCRLAVKFKGVRFYIDVRKTHIKHQLSKMSEINIK